MDSIQKLLKSTDQHRIVLIVGKELSFDSTLLDSLFAHQLTADSFSPTNSNSTSFLRDCAFIHTERKKMATPSPLAARLVELGDVILHVFTSIVGETSGSLGLEEGQLTLINGSTNTMVVHNHRHIWRPIESTDEVAMFRGDLTKLQYTELYTTNHGRQISVRSHWVPDVLVPGVDASDFYCRRGIGDAISRVLQAKPTMLITLGTISHDTPFRPHLRRLVNEVKENKGATIHVSQSPRPSNLYDHIISCMHWETFMDMFAKFI